SAAVPAIPDGISQIDAIMPRAQTPPVATPGAPQPEPPAIHQATAPPVAAASPVAAAPVAPAKMNPPHPHPPTPPASGNLWLRVGLFSVRDNAERLESKLRAAGFAVGVDKQIVGGKDMYRVRAGPVHDRAEALDLQARLKASGQDSFLLPP